MSTRRIAICLLALLLVGPGVIQGMAGEHRLGGGAHYWKTIDAIDKADSNDIDEDGLAYLASYQYVAGGFFKLEANLEIFPDGIGGAGDTVLAPQAFALLGSGLYGGLGVGTFYTDSDFGDDLFYVVRAGIDLELLPALRLDIHANYHFTEFDSIKTIDETVDTDTITIGAMIRLVL